MDLKHPLKQTIYILFYLSAMLLNASEPADSTALNLRSSLIRLPWAEAEVSNVADLYDGRAFIRESASESAFKTHAGDARIIHLATHAVVDNGNPMESKLVFNADTANGEDGFLNAYELYHLQLNADLAVLSACNTGYGKMLRGEGIMSLARGFMAAGCPSVIMSLWPVDDQATQELMTVFYRNLANGMDKDEALRRAKLDYIQHGDSLRTGPFFWAGMLHIGQPGPLPNHGHLKMLVMYVAAGLLLTAVIFILRRKKIAAAMLVCLVFLCAATGTDPVPSGSDDSQIAADTTLAKQLFVKAGQLQRNAQTDSAFLCYRESAALFKKHQQWIDYAKCLNAEGFMLAVADSFDRAFHCFSMVTDSLSDLISADSLVLAQTHNDIGVTYYFQGDYNRAIENYEKSMQIRLRRLPPDHLVLAMNYSNMGACYSAKGNPDRSIEFKSKALEIAKMNIDKNPFYVARCYNGMAIAYNDNGEYMRALEFYEHALNIYTEKYGDAHPDIAMICNNMANTYANMQQYDRAIDMFLKAVRIDYRFENPDASSKLAIRLANLGSTYLDVKQPQKAVEYTMQSLKMRQKLYSEQNADIANNYEILGQAYEKLGQYDRSKAYFEKSLDIRGSILGEAHPQVAKARKELGRFYFNRNEPEKAVSCYEDAIAVLLPGRDFSTSFPPSLIQESDDLVLLLETLELNGDAYRAMAASSGHDSLLYPTLENYTAAMAVLDTLRSGFRSAPSARFLSEDRFPLFEKSIDTCWRLAESSGDRGMIRQAFIISENAKSFVLRSMIQNDRAKTLSNVPKSRLAQENDLRSDWMYYENRLNELTADSTDRDIAAERETRKKLFETKRLYESFLTGMERDYPVYRSLKRQTDVPEPASIQKKLTQNGKVLLSYFYGNGSVYGFVLSGDRLDMIRLPADSAHASVQAMLTGIKDRNPDMYSEHAYRLYAMLMRPFEDEIRDRALIIVPDGILGYVPFEALLTEPVRGTRTNPAGFPYLLNGHAITYDYSAASHFMAERIRPHKTKLSFIGFAPIEY
ncbi:CHAT domain-containing protein [bacterium]|nr:CHAT domain-containing protein [bacterium]